MERNKRESNRVALELLYIYGVPNFETSLENVLKKHMYIIEVDAYSIEKMVDCIWKEEWNKDLFCDGPSMNTLYSKLKALTHKDPKNRPSLSSILET
jgi:hypothetical protein